MKLFIPLVFIATLTSTSLLSQALWVASGNHIINDNAGGGVRVLQHATSASSIPSYGNWAFFSEGSTSHTSGTATKVWAAYLLGINKGPGTLNEVIGANVLAGNENSASGTVTNAYALRAKVQSGLGTVTNGYGVYIDVIGGTNSYGLYQSNSSNKNFFAGNVGIGTVPTAKLDVAGDIRWGTSMLRIDQGGSIEIRGTGLPYIDLSNDATADYDARIILQDNDVLRIAGANVGIGTSDPGSFKLAVEGKIGAREVHVTVADPWPDYVFEPEYKLKDLNELESFIKTYKHLPDVPSAEEIQKNGHELGGMDMVLLRKIEELTLYLLELRKEIEIIQKENLDLKSSLNMSTGK